MRYELTDYEWAAIRPICRTRCEACLVWTIDAFSTASAGAAIRHTMARSAGLLWSMHHLLQPFRPMAKGRSVGPDHGLTCCRS
jgi:hypothetical protein